MRAGSSLRHWLVNSCHRHNQRGTGPHLDRSGIQPAPSTCNYGRDIMRSAASDPLAKTPEEPQIAFLGINESVKKMVLIR